MKVYCISGLGANCNVFDEISLPPSYQKIYLEWIDPKPNESLESYAHRMAENIKPNEDFMLLGLSFGGIIAQEIAQFSPPKQLILISTIKSEKEIPRLLRWARISKVHRFIPIAFFTSDRVLSYAFFRKLYDKNLPDLKSIFTYRDPHYLRWSFDSIINWKPKSPLAIPTTHIHGNNDPIFPIKKIENPVIIKNGNHLMIVLKRKSLQKIINSLLEKH